MRRKLIERMATNDWIALSILAAFLIIGELFPKVGDGHLIKQRSSALFQYLR